MFTEPSIKAADLELSAVKGQQQQQSHEVQAAAGDASAPTAERQPTISSEQLELLEQQRNDEQVESMTQQLWASHALQLSSLANPLILKENSHACCMLSG
jgi:hypothetical protein